MPDSQDNQIVRVGFSRLGWFLIIGFGVLQLSFVIVQMSLQEDQRSTGDRSLEVAVTQLRESLPAIRDSRRLTQAALEDLPESRRLTEESLELARETTPLVRDLRTARVDESTRAAGALAGTLLENDVAGATRAGRDLAVGLLRADLPGLTARLADADLPRLATDLGAVTGELTRKRRLRRLLVRSNAVLGETRARHLVAKATRAAELAPEQVAILQESMKIQAQTLALQKEAVAIGREALVVAKEAEKHAESVDRKTGGTFPGSAGGNGG